MATDLTWWDKILATWAIAAGVSLLYSYFRVYRGRARYLYLFSFGAWAVFWGANHFSALPLLPPFTLPAMFVLSIALMLADSLRRYRETNAQLRQENQDRLNKL